MKKESEADLRQAVESFMFMMKHGDFLAWEAVMAQKQELRLTHQQEVVLEHLINFNDPEDDQVLYIDEMPRPSEPWYAIFNKIVPNLLVEPFRTFDMHYDEQCECWGRLVWGSSPRRTGLPIISNAKKAGTAAKKGIDEPYLTDQDRICDNCKFL